MSNQKHNYMMLSRLKGDCEYFLNHGNRCEKHLWAGNVAEQIAEMKGLWESLDEKPEWMTMKDIEEYEAKMSA